MSERVIPPRGRSVLPDVPFSDKMVVVGTRLVGTIVCPAGVYELYVEDFPDRDPNPDLGVLESLRAAFAKGDTIILGNLYTLKRVGGAPDSTGLRSQVSTP